MHIRPADVPLRAETSNDLVMRMLVRADQLGEGEPSLSATWVQLDGHHRALRTDASDRLYVVLDGSGTIRMDGQAVQVQAHDLVLIPRGTVYELDGEVTYLVINTPPFRDGDDIYIDQ